MPKMFLAILTIELRLVNWTRLTVIDFARLCNSCLKKGILRFVARISPL